MISGGRYTPVRKVSARAFFVSSLSASGPVGQVSSTDFGAGAKVDNTVRPVTGVDRAHRVFQDVTQVFQRLVILRDRLMGEQPSEAKDPGNERAGPSGVMPQLDFRASNAQGDLACIFNLLTELEVQFQ